MNNQKKSWTYTLILASAGLMMTIGTTWGVHRSVHHYEQERFHQLADVLESEILKRAQQYELGLRNVVGLFQASQQVEFGEFRRMGEAIRVCDVYPGSLGVGFVQMVPDDADALRDFERRLVAEGAPEFRVHNVGENSYQPDHYRLKKRLVVGFIEPFAPNSESLGLDIGTEAKRREAAERAYFSRQGTISRPIQLVQSGSSETGFLYLVPVFRNGSDSREFNVSAAIAESESDATFLGWVYMPIVISKALHNVEERVGKELAFQVSEPDQSESLFTSTGFPRTSEWEDDRSIQIGGRQWYLQIRPSAKFHFADHDLVQIIFLSGVFCTLIASAAVRILSNRASHAQELARQMTTDLHRLAMVAKRTTNIVVLTDPDRKIVWVNDAFTRITGYEPSEVIGRNPGEVLQCDQTDAETVLEIRRRLANREAFSGEIYNQTKDGVGYWVNLEIQPMQDQFGNHAGFLAINHDITERKESARKLKEETRRTNLALDNGKMAIWDWNAQTDELVLDERWAHIVGPFDEHAGKFNSYWADRVHPDDRQAYQQVLETSIHHDRAEGEWRYRNSVGGYVWVLVRGNVVSRDQQGMPLRLTGTVTEITDRKIAEQALEESQIRAKAIFDCSNEAIFMFNEKGFVECNPKTVQMFGFDRKDEIMGFHPAELSPPMQPDGSTIAQATQEKLDQVMRDGSIRFEWVHQRKSGELFEAEVSLALVAREPELLVMAILKDVSERKELERQLSQAQKLESIGQLAAGVAHEINTPMQCVFSNIEYLQDAFNRVLELTEAYRSMDRDDWNETSRDTIEQLEQVSRFDRVSKHIREATSESGEAARRVIEIVRAMKTMSHPGTSGKVTIDLNGLVEDAAVISRNRWKYVAKLTRDLDPDLPAIPVLPAQMSQVILNLMVNAADAISEKIGDEPMELGSIVLRTLSAQDGVTIQISDSGNGMPEHVQKRIFDPFFTTKDVGKGTGQGLAIAYDVIVNQHGGRIDVTSKVGEGSIFSIWLPSRVEEPTAV